MLVFDRSKINGINHLVWNNGKIYFTDEAPNNCFIYGSDCCRSINNMAKLFLKEIPEIIPENFSTMVNTLGIQNPNWVSIMGKEKFMDCIKKVISSYEHLRQGLEMSTVRQQLKIECLMRMMNPVKYDVSKIDQSLLPRFNTKLKPYLKDGLLQQPYYIRTKTKTGRLTVQHGPSVLTMHAGLRKGLVDAIQIDFRSCEPNLLLAYQGREVYPDLYSTLAEEVFNGKLSRAKVKLSIIASLYNSERRNKNAQAIAEFFQVDKIVEELESSVNNGVLKNMYNRPILVEETRKNHLLSLWLQSSAVDAALTGFCNLVSSNKLVKPYWIIHDALIINNVDINVDHLDVGNNFMLPIKIGSFDEE